jgi:hypothetical protein
MKQVLPILFCFLAIVLNWFIYSSTTDKINRYKHTPPFPALDYTWSPTGIFPLLDGDHTTYWIKDKEGAEWDFDIELRFSHVLKNDQYQSIPYTELSIVPCEGYPPISINMELVKREGINVDKELRLPKEELIEKINIRDIKEPFIYDISKYFNKTESKYEYDGFNMYIIALKARLLSVQGKACIAEIEIRE